MMLSTSDNLSILHDASAKSNDQLNVYQSHLQYYELEMYSVKLYLLNMNDSNLNISRNPRDTNCGAFELTLAKK